MTVEDRFKGRYEAGDTPWDIGKADFNLKQIVNATPIEPCKAVDIGCGSGDNAIWLSQRGFHVVGIDTSEAAIEKAKEKASKANVNITFLVSNILKDQVECQGRSKSRPLWRSKREPAEL
jgi:2-polyprenyl-3-methyl-5-hydroxy-6-metoxy-1,4-benzoquinol methylase